jgi:hypothetical protein
MRTLTWRKLLRSALLATGVSLGLDVISDPTLPQHMAVADDLAKSAATVAEAAKVINLETLPIPEGATPGEARQVGMLNYSVSTDVKSALEFHRKQLLKLGWKELPRGESEPTYT